METQTTDGGEGAAALPQPLPADVGAHRGKQWIPQPGTEQWSGSVPSSTDDAAADRSTDEGGPTEADLLQAMEEFEKQQAEEDLAEAAREAGSLF